MPGSGASIATHRLTRSGWEAATAKPTMMPMSCVTNSAVRTPSASRTPTTPADAYVDLGAVGFDLTRLHTGREGVDAILMSVVVHRFIPGLKGTWLRRRGGPVDDRIAEAGVP